MRIVHVPYTYYPDPVGGTEIYVEQLASSLRAHEIESVIVAPGKMDAAYKYADTRVYRIGVTDAVRDLNELYGEGDVDAARAFEKILQREKPDVVHLHAFTRIVSVRLAQISHAHNIPVVFTYHTPTVSCLRSGLMLWGREVCDGKLDADRCTRCRLHSLGLPKPAATLFARVPQPLRAAVQHRQGGVYTALRMRDLVARQHAAFHALMENVDLIIVLCGWTHRVLLNNGVTPEKIRIVPHGLANEPGERVRVEHNRARADALRVVTLGRLEPIKGIDLMVHALRALPTHSITLDIYGISQSETETPYARELGQLIQRDERIRLLPPVPHAQVISLLSQYDVLAVPSQWLETGPLVVLEGFAAGLPIVGSNLGGIAEKVQDGVNGLLLPSLDASAWREAFRTLADDRALVARLRGNVKPPRAMEEVAAERATFYQELVAGMRGRT